MRKSPPTKSIHNEKISQKEDLFSFCTITSWTCANTVYPFHCSFCQSPQQTESSLTWRNSSSYNQKHAHPLSERRPKFFRMIYSIFKPESLEVFPSISRTLVSPPQYASTYGLIITTSKPISIVWRMEMKEKWTQKRRDMVNLAGWYFVEMLKMELCFP